MAINVKISTIASEAGGVTLFELDVNDDFMPNDEFYQNFDVDENNDPMPPIPGVDVEDKEFELDENRDIMPKV